MKVANFSILCSVFANVKQIKNFLWSVCNQDYKGPFETIVIGNAAKSHTICTACCGMPSKIKISFYDCMPSHNFTSTAINLAAQKASGRYLVIVNDLSMSLPADLLSLISKTIKPNSVILPTDSIVCLSRMNFYKYGQYPSGKNHWNEYLKKLPINKIKQVKNI